jgi:transketolase N-terminal domain/subunit
MNLRKKILQASLNSGACHIGSALSCVEIIQAIHEIKKEEDVFIFSKASGVSTYYCYKYPIEEATELLKKYPLPSKEAGLI